MGVVDKEVQMLWNVKASVRVETGPVCESCGGMGATEGMFPGHALACMLESLGPAVWWAS